VADITSKIKATVKNVKLGSKSMDGVPYPVYTINLETSDLPQEEIKKLFAIHSTQKPADITIEFTNPQLSFDDMDDEDDVDFGGGGSKNITINIVKETGEVISDSRDEEEVPTEEPTADQNPDF
jgi:hypothetical protein